MAMQNTLTSTPRTLSLTIDTDDDFAIDGDWSGIISVNVPMLPEERAIDTYARWLNEVVVEGDGALEWLQSLLEPKNYWCPCNQEHDWGPDTHCLDIPGGNWSLEGYVDEPNIREELSIETLLRFLNSHGKTVDEPTARTFLSKLEEATK